MVSIQLMRSKSKNSKSKNLQRLLWIADEYDNIFQNLIGKEPKSKVLSRMMDIKMN